MKEFAGKHKNGTYIEVCDFEKELYVYIEQHGEGIRMFAGNGKLKVKIDNIEFDLIEYIDYLRKVKT